MTSTKLLMIAGPARSGTTMLHRLVNTHPKIAVTSEFRQFMTLGRTYPLHVYRLNNSHSNDHVFPHSPTKPEWRLRLFNLNQSLRYAIGVFNGPCCKVRQQDVLRSMHAMYPWASYVGDKYPDYIYDIPRFVKIPGMVRLVIFRDPRDATASTLEILDRSWKKHSWSEKFSSPTKVAKRWVSAMQMISDYADHLYVIRYEDLVTNPKAEMARLGEFLQLDPDEFDSRIVFDASVGSYKQRLTAEQIAEVEAIAGQYLTQFGYV